MIFNKKKVTNGHNDIMYYELLDPVDASGKYVKGGVEDIGNFKEGFCFSLNYKKSNRKSKWVICSDSYVILISLFSLRSQNG